MTDAREIIALAIEPFVHHADDVTSVVISVLDAAGFRILGPDEVDSVTVERIAEFAKSEFQRNFESPVGWRDQFAAAIRALGRKA